MKTFNELAHDEFEQNFDMLSDLDYGYCSATGEYEIPMAEWDGPYGRHWSKYVSEEARTKALNEHTAKMEAWVAKREVELMQEAQQRISKRVANDNTLANLCPQLAKLAK